MNNIINGNLLTINDYYNDIISINIMHSNKQKNNNDKIVNIVDNYGLINVDEDYNLNTKKEYNTLLIKSLFDEIQKTCTDDIEDEKELILLEAFDKAHHRDQHL